VSIPLPDGQILETKPNQIIVWISVTQPHEDPPPKDSAFPVVLDTGFNNEFLIRINHFRAWTRRHPNDFGRCADLKFQAGGAAPRIDVALWLYRNVPGAGDLSDDPPHRLELNRGAAIAFDDRFARLPLLGMGALQANDLVLHVFAKRRRITIETADPKD
jgi:hypothetical protein